MLYLCYICGDLGNIVAPALISLSSPTVRRRFLTFLLRKHRRQIVPTTRVSKLRRLSSVIESIASCSNREKQIHKENHVNVTNQAGNERKT